MADPQLALQRSRYGRVLKPKRDSAFDYSAFLINSFKTSAFEYCFMLHSASAPATHANTDSQPPATVRGTALSRLRRELVQSGERVFYVETPTGPEWMVMLRGSGTIMVYNVELGTFYNEPTEVLLEDLRDYTPWPRSRSFRALTAEEVELPARLDRVSWMDDGQQGASFSALRLLRRVAESIENECRNRWTHDGAAVVHGKARIAGEIRNPSTMRFRAVLQRFRALRLFLCRRVFLCWPFRLLQVPRCERRRWRPN